MPSTQTPLVLSPVAAGELLRRKRELTGMTQEQVIERAGIPSLTQYSQFEKGKVSVARSKYFPVLAQILALTEDEVRSVNPSAVFDAPTPLPATPSGRFVPSSRLSLYGTPEGMTYVPSDIDRPQVEAVLLDNHGMEAGGMLYGATLYVDPAERTPEAGRVYLLEHDGGYDVRRAAAHGSEVWYYADSPAQGGPPLQAGRVKVLGRVFRFVNPPHDA